LFKNERDTHIFIHMISFHNLKLKETLIMMDFAP
jgi:hypothetical protein